MIQVFCCDDKYLLVALFMEQVLVFHKYICSWQIFCLSRYTLTHDIICGTSVFRHDT